MHMSHSKHFKVSTRIKCSKTHIAHLGHMVRMALQGVFGVQARRGCQEGPETFHVTLQCLKKCWFPGFLFSPVF